MAAANTATRSDWNTVVIVGAGLGGLTAGLQLAHAGFRVFIIERNVTLSEAGAGIQLSPNAGRVLSRLGLDRAIAAAAIEPRSIDVRAGHGGATLSSLPARAFRDRYKMPWRVIHRSDLQAALADACRGHSGVTLLTGTTVRDTLVQENGLLVRIGKPDGIDVIPAAALIGADGVWSSTRARIPGGATATPSGMTAWRATIAADIARDIAPMDRVMLWLGHEGHVVHYPIAHGAALNVVAIVPEPWDKQGWSAPGDRGEIQQHFNGWTSDIRRVLSAPLAWHKHAIATVDPRMAWCDGRVALLGDAAHAMHPYLAQGAAMAMEDGAVLAAALRGASDVPAALRAYEAERKARVARVAKAAVATAAQYHATGIMRLGRNAALTLAGPRLILQRNDWIYRWTADARA